MDTKGFQLKLESQSKCFSYHPTYAVLLGSVDAAVLFEYLLSVADGRHLFPVTEVDVRAATGLGAIALHTARKALLDRSVIGFGMVKKKPTYTVYAAIFDGLLNGVIDAGEKMLAKTEPQPVATPEAPLPLSINDLFESLAAESEGVAFKIPGGIKEVKIATEQDYDKSAYHLGVALCKVCGDIDVNINIGRAIGTVKRLLDAKTKPTVRLIEFQYSDPRGWWRNIDFRGRKGQTPTIYQIESTWGSWGEAFAPPEEIDVTAEAAALLAYGTPGLSDVP